MLSSCIVYTGYLNKFGLAFIWKKQGGPYMPFKRKFMFPFQYSSCLLYDCKYSLSSKYISAEEFESPLECMWRVEKLYQQWSPSSKRVPSSFKTALWLGLILWWLLFGFLPLFQKIQRSKKERKSYWLAQVWSKARFESSNVANILQMVWFMLKLGMHVDWIIRGLEPAAFSLKIFLCIFCPAKCTEQTLAVWILANV